MRDIDEISGEVLDGALRLNRDLSPGLLEIEAARWGCF